MGTGRSFAKNDFFFLSSGDVGDRCNNGETGVLDWLGRKFAAEVEIGIGIGVGVVPEPPFSVVRGELGGGLVSLDIDKEVPLSLLFVWLFMWMLKGDRCRDWTCASSVRYGLGSSACGVRSNGNEDPPLSLLVPLRLNGGLCCSRACPSSAIKDFGKDRRPGVFRVRSQKCSGSSSVALPELLFPERFRHLKCFMALVGVSMTSRSAQYPAGNQTHSWPSLAGRGGSRLLLGVAGALLFTLRRAARLALTTEATDDDGNLLVEPSIPEMLRARYRLAVLLGRGTSVEGLTSSGLSSMANTCEALNVLYMKLILEFCHS